MHTEFVKFCFLKLCIVFSAFFFFFRSLICSKTIRQRFGRNASPYVSKSFAVCDNELVTSGVELVMRVNFCFLNEIFSCILFM